MIANGWKTAEQIQVDYQMRRSSWQNLKATCLESDFSDAIVLVGGKTYVIEDRWQAFLIYLSQKKKEKSNGAKTKRRKVAIK